MIVKTFIYFVITTLLVFFSMSCSSDFENSPYSVNSEESGSEGKNNTTEIGIFPLDLDSYWIYEKYQLDDNNEITSNSKSYDSVVASELIKSNNQYSYQVLTYNRLNTQYRQVREDKYISKNNQIWTYEPWLNTLLGEMPFNILPFSDTTQIKILDLDDDLWRVYRIKLEDESISGIPIGTINGKADILCSWEGTRNIKVNNSTYETEEYLTTMSINLELEIPFLGTQNIIIERELYNYFAKNIGLVKSVMTSSGINIPIFGEIPLPGFEKNLIKYQE